ncbi:glycosyltransferase family 2 protein [Zavarzinia sp. CC-PAN008]|uniref:glycosyltransferase family 2 protein n=1 Tax=Zavarzinia sp. CC-PAN008 TaxID=3243332 RepID=UPI003F742C8F
MPPEPIAAVAERPHVSVVVPTLNEERHIEACLRSIAATSYPADRFEILVVDGGSSDRTVAIAREVGRALGNVRVLDNPGRIQSRAINIGAAHADPRSVLLIRADAHSIYPADFVALCVDSTLANAADVTVFVAVPVAQGGCFQKAVAAAQSIPLGVGNSTYRLHATGGAQEVEHGFHGCFRRDVYARVGGYDDSFTHNEDGELSYRIREAGGRIMLDDRIRVDYVPRRTPGALLRQYRLYGRGRSRNQMKHGMRPRLRQAAPVLLIGFEGLVALLAVLAGVGVLPAWPAWAGVAVLVSYLVLLVLAGAGLALRRRDPCLLLLPLALGIMHHAWGFGFAEQRLAGPGPIDALPPLSSGPLPREH